jgi:selenocysteine lyase/cysteine desulfurase
MRILTTDAEFYSFRRQTERLAEDGLVDITRIPTQPFDTFTQRFADAAAGNYDMVFLSHVFFDSGYTVQGLEKIVTAVKSKDTFIVIDGYHGFMAMPTDLSKIADRVFYMAGGYKYAMAGEGACFMHCPEGYGARPRNTGWFAEMDRLAAGKSGKVGYAVGGGRFSGATFEPSGLYRLRAVLEWLKDINIGVTDIHGHVHGLQEFFVDNLKSPDICAESLLVGVNNAHRGHFLTFHVLDAEGIRKRLAEKNVVTDNRGNRLRFGFAIYHDKDDVKKLLSILGEK